MEQYAATMFGALDVDCALAEKAVCSYPNSTAAYLAPKDFIAFHASRVESCSVGDERVKAQVGDFSTSRILGPFTGPPSTGRW